MFRSHKETEKEKILEKLSELQKEEEKAKEFPGEDKKKKPNYLEAIEKEKEAKIETEEITEDQYIAKLFVDLYGGSQKISIREFTKKLNENHKISYSYTTVRTKLIEQGVYEPGGSIPQRTVETVSTDTRVIWEILFNLIISSRAGDKWILDDDELDKLSKTTDRCLLAHNWGFGRHQPDVDFGFALLAIISSRIDIGAWRKKPKSHSSLEEALPEKP